MDFGPTTQQFDSVYSHDALPPGTRLGGYQIIEVLGRGGFGIVYLALDSSLQRQVAIKEYLPADLAMRCEDGQVWVRPGADPGAYAAGMTAFLSEAKMLARFDHPSLARVHTFWEENRSAYMVMPYYQGRTMAALLAEMKAPPDEAWLRSLLTPLLSALSTLHNAQCLHLDISPDNIIVLKDGRPVLLDFGVASRVATDKTMPLTALLNPAYAPIEQYSETATLPQGPWSDLYALASVLHFAIAGRPPARATVRAIEDPQRPLAETVAARAEQFPGLSYSESFLAAIDKALAVKPRERPRSAAEFQMLLDNMPPPALRGGAEPQGFASPLGGMAAPPVSPVGGEPRVAPTFAEPPREAWFAAEPSDAPPKPARSRAPWLIAAVATVGLAAVGGWAWLQRQPALAQITAADLPPAVVARIPKAASAAASGIATPAPAAPEQQVATQSAPPPPTPVQVAPAPGPAPTARAGTAQVNTAPAAPVDAAPAAAPGVAQRQPDNALPPTAAGSAPAPSATSQATSATPAPGATAQGAQTSTQTAAANPNAEEPAAPEAGTEAPAKATPAPAPARTKKPAKAAAAAPAAPPIPAEPNNPRAVCGNRSNFALVYCMQQQCKRWKFSNHPQCIEMERRGEL